MAAQSTLRTRVSTNAAQVASHYMRNQPSYRRVMLSSLVAYVLGTAYQALNPKARKGVKKEEKKEVLQDEGESKGKGGRRKKKGPRVEVRLPPDHAVLAPRSSGARADAGHRWMPSSSIASSASYAS